MTDRLALIKARHAEAGGGDGDLAWLVAEVERLRANMGLCRAQLFKAASYRGYEGGPLAEPTTERILRLCKEE